MLVFSKVPNLKQLKELNPKLSHLLWDMDGTIMKTEHLHTDATCFAIKKLSPNSSFDYKLIDEVCMGATDFVCMSRLIEKKIIPNTTLNEFIELKNQYFKNELPKVLRADIFDEAIKSLLDEAKKEDIKVAVVTSSEKDVTNMLLKHLNIKNEFSFILTREDTSKNKPDPMPYLEAVKKFNVNKDNCLIFEDSPTGLKAANSSEIKFIKAQWY